MKKLFFSAAFIIVSSAAAFAQFSLPRESNRAELTQVIGDTRVSVVYHRPNAKGRQIWGCTTADVIPKGGVNYPCLVPNGQVWRTGANENTTFEVSREVKINGQTLPAGKYGLHTIPNNDSWIVIFNKVNNEWGSYRYDEKQDQLRVTVQPQTVAESQETMSINFDNIKGNTADAVIRWEKVRVSFTIDIGDMNARLVADARRMMASQPVQMANYVLNQKMTGSYEEALTWLDGAIRTRETFGALNTKARLLAEMGRTNDAITTAERAVQVGKAAQPAANTADLERLLAEWKAKK